MGSIFIFIDDSPNRVLTADTVGVAMLTIRTLEDEDEGTYACFASSDAGNDEQRVYVSIEDNDVDRYPNRGDTPGCKH